MDAWDIMPAQIANLVAQGITDFYLINHASEQDAGSALVRLFDGKADIRLLRKDSRPFFQGAMMTLLARLAYQDGFDVFLPLDSDEFVDCDDPGTDLTHELGRWVEEEKSLGLTVPVVDYVQSASVEMFTSGSLASCIYRCLPNRAQVPGWPVEGPRPYFTHEPEYKAFLNLRAIEDADAFAIAEGNHAILPGPDGRGAVTRTVSPTLVIRHLPFRSRQGTLRRQEHGARRRLAGWPAGSGWQNQQLAELSPSQLADYWEGSSWTLGATGSPGLTGFPAGALVEDRSMEAILARAESVGVGLDHPLMRDRAPRTAPVTPGTPSAPIEASALSLALDAWGGLTIAQMASDQRRQELESQLDRLGSELAERDGLVAERDAIAGSRIWRYSAPYRLLRDRLKRATGGGVR